MCVAAISWAKRAFRLKFDKEEWFIKFHQLIARLLVAPTIQIASLIQDQIVVWLEDVKEGRASKWYEKTWTGEHGYYTSASAGYNGNNMASGLESTWRYLRRDTVGNAGANMSMSLEVFAPSLLKYVKDASEKHADKMVDPKTGRGVFPVLPEADAALWKEVQQFDMLRIRLAYVEGNKTMRQAWQYSADFFNNEDAEGEGETKSFIEKLTLFRATGQSFDIARTRMTGIIMPTETLLKTLIRKGNKSFKQLEFAVHALVPQYDTLFNKTGDFMDENPGMPPEAILDIMDSFVRYTLISRSTAFSHSNSFHATGSCRFKSGPVQSCSSAPAGVASPTSYAQNLWHVPCFSIPS